MNLKQHLILRRDLHDLYKKRPLQVYENISYANWYPIPAKTYWFTRFVRERMKVTDVPIRFYSEFGPRSTVEEHFDGIKVFYTGENVAPIRKYRTLHYREEKVAGWESRMKTYRDFCTPYTALSMGFEEKADGNYLRFPFWILRHCDPLAGPDELTQYFEQINALRGDQQRQGCALIASHDFLGSRSDIADTLAGSGVFSDIAYAGKWRHNTDDLQNSYHNNKKAYLEQFRFNICPENMDAPLYVTEKIFDAFAAGTIPIYGGALGKPEPEIICPESYVHWNFDGDHTEAVEEVRRLTQNDDAYLAFLQRPRFQKDAGTIVYERYYKQLEEKLRALL